jgi:starch synthase
VQLFNARTGTGTGIVFDDFNEVAMNWALNTGLDLYQDKRTWRKLVRNGMLMDYSWERQGRVYVDMYRQMLGRQR